ncbi:unnamed protein product [Phytophthora lilii]|uniref:Unnamed protein product n=1 Tax=Phytophthora lilii TaxID=2077276 RepID=A0A9W6TAC3_9STRA|nr:unnamed protein product [Phytophthora lilii]
MSSDADIYHHPVLAVSHGPGPLWLLKHGVKNRTSRPARNVALIFKKLYPGGAHKPKRILLVSAHWETYRIGFEISKSPAPGMLYDYEGFPPETYTVVYPAKGDADFANEVASLLTRSKIRATQVLRAFDHAAFVPLTLIRRQADIPVVTLSINWKLNARAHFDLGRALAPLRDQDTLIICSGQATHGLAGQNGEIPQSGLDFQEWLDLVLTKGEDEPELTMPEATKLFGGWGVENHLSYASYAWGAPPTDQSAALQTVVHYPVEQEFSNDWIQMENIRNPSGETTEPKGGTVELDERGKSDDDVVSSPGAALEQEVVKVHVKVHQNEAAPQPEEHAPAKKHSHHKQKGEEVTDNGETVRNYDRGTARIKSKDAKHAKKHAKGHHHKDAPGKASTDETVVEYEHGTVKTSGQKTSAATDGTTKNTKGKHKKAATPDEQEVTSTATKVNELVTKLSSTTSTEEKSFIDAYGPVVVICGIIGGIAAIVGVAGLVMGQPQQSDDNLDSVRGASEDLDIDVEANITSAGAQDAADDGDDLLDDSDSDANDDEEEEGTFANGTTHVSVHDVAALGHRRVAVAHRHALRHAWQSAAQAGAHVGAGAVGQGGGDGLRVPTQSCVRCHELRVRSTGEAVAMETSPSGDLSARPRGMLTDLRVAVQLQCPVHLGAYGWL